MKDFKENCFFNRLDLINYLEQNKIGPHFLFAGNFTKKPYFKDVKFRRIEDLKNTDYIMNNSFEIGVHLGINLLMIDYIVEKIENFIRLNF